MSQRWNDSLYMQDMEWEQIIGIAAGVLTASSMLPQLIKVIKEKEVEDLSVMMLIVLLSGLGLWVAYGIMRKDAPILYTNLFSVVVNLALLMLWIKYSKKNTN